VWIAKWQLTPLQAWMSMSAIHTPHTLVAALRIQTYCSIGTFLGLQVEVSLTGLNEVKSLTA